MGTTFIEWSPAAKAGSPDPIVAQSPPNHYPEPDWDSRSVTAVDDKEGAPDGQELLELPQQSRDRSDGALTGDWMDDALRLDDVIWTEDGTADHTSMFEHVSDAGLEVFEDLLDPALFGSDAPPSQPSSLASSQDINTHQSDREDELDLPSLDTLLYRNPTHLPPKPHDTPRHETSTESTLQIQGCIEVQGPNGTPIPQELPDQEPETRAPVSNHSLVATESCHVSVKYARRGAQILQPLKRRSKRPQPPKKRSKCSNTREQAEQCRARELKDAETEWTRRGYPRISWRRLNSRLKEYSSALRSILNGTSSSIYRTELESAVARKDNRNISALETRRPVITVLVDNRSCKLTSQPLNRSIFPSLSCYYITFLDNVRMQHIMIEFGYELRRRAVTDQLVRATGVGGYVITVLVPELAAMQVKEDMKVCDKSARQILQESGGLGEMLHEDV